MTRVPTFAVLAVILSACTQSPRAPETMTLDWDQLLPMVEAFGYEQGIDNFCGGDMTGLDDFLAELSNLPLGEGLLDQANSRAQEIRTEFAEADPVEDAETICNVEMFLGSERRAAEQREIWRALGDQSQ